MLRKLLLASLGLLAFGHASAQVQTYAKPIVRDAWADAAASGDIADPGNSFVSAGWLSSSTPPARQYFNWAFNYPSEGIRYFEQRGIVDWDTLETYAIGGVVRGPSGLLYQSLINSNTGNTPASSTSQWGSLTTVTPATSDNSNDLATTAFVHTLVAPFAPLASPALTGVPTAPTAATNTNTNQIATTANVVADIASAISPLAHLASPAFSGVPTAPTAATGTNNAQVATTANVVATASSLIASSIAPLAPKASPALTGDPTAPTAAAGTNTTQIATTAFVQSAANPGCSVASPGYCKLPAGVILEWGLSGCESSAPGTTVTFPLAFPHAVFSVQVSAFGGNANVTVLAQNAANFSCINGANGETDWFAVGY